MAYVPSISLAPSSVERWTTCTASPQYLLDNHKRLPDDRTRFNEEGNQAHHVANAVLLGRKIPTHCPKSGKIDPAKIPEMTRYAKGFKNFCLDREYETWHTEQQIDLFYWPERNGYIDFVGYTPMVIIRIVDLKYGQGVAVTAEENDQMCVYARSYVEQNLVQGMDYDDDTLVAMSIWQPRTREGDTETTWTITWAELKKRTDGIAVIAKKIIAKEPGLVFKPSEDACRWCKAKTFCKAKNGKLAQIIPPRPATGKIILPDPDTLTEAQVSAVLTHRKAIVKWMEEIHKAHYSKALGGHVPDGFKLVKGRGGRKWTDVEDASDTLTMFLDEETVRPRGIISPNQAEVALKELGMGKDCLPQVTHYDGKPTLAPMDDKRPAINVDPSTVFDDVTEDDLPESNEDPLPLG